MNLSQRLASILVVALAASGCSSSSEEETTPLTSMVDTVSCDFVRSLVPLYATFRPAPGVDGITFYALESHATPGAPKDDEVKVKEAQLRHVLGTPCADATCEAARAKLAASKEESRTGWEYSDADVAPGGATNALGFAIVTRGGEHTLVDTVDELQPFVTPLGSPAEAQAWAWLKGVPATCDTAQNARRAGGGYELRKVYYTCNGFQRARTQVEVIVRVATDGTITESAPRELSRESVEGCGPVAGRKPAALEAGRADGAGTVATYLAELARLEAAAVLAFDELASELERFGAPRELVERARRAREEEAEHAQCMRMHASRAGGEVAEARSTPHRYVSLFELARHNAVEGCVRETFGALVAMHQAERAADPWFREDMGKIAREEVSHAAWSHDVDAWLATRLSAEERACVEAEKRAAFAALVQESEAATVDGGTVIGLPDVETTRALVTGLGALVFAAA